MYADVRCVDNVITFIRYCPEAGYQFWADWLADVHSKDPDDGRAEL